MKFKIGQTVKLTKQFADYLKASDARVIVTGYDSRINGIFTGRIIKGYGEHGIFYQEGLERTFMEHAYELYEQIYIKRDLYGQEVIAYGVPDV